MSFLCDAVEKKHWDIIKDHLIKSGHIDQKNVLLCVNDGVVYLEPNTGRKIQDILGQLFGNGFLEQ